MTNIVNGIEAIGSHLKSEVAKVTRQHESLLNKVQTKDQGLTAYLDETNKVQVVDLQGRLGVYNEGTDINTIMHKANGVGGNVDITVV